MEDAKWFKKLCFQLPVVFGFDIFGIQPTFITKSIVFEFDAFIIGPFLEFLGMIEMFFTNNYQFS